MQDLANAPSERTGALEVGDRRAASSSQACRGPGAHAHAGSASFIATSSRRTSSSTSCRQVRSSPRNLRLRRSPRSFSSSDGDATAHGPRANRAASSARRCIFSPEQAREREERRPPSRRVGSRGCRSTRRSRAGSPGRAATSVGELIVAIWPRRTFRPSRSGAVDHRPELAARASTRGSGASPAAALREMDGLRRGARAVRVRRRRSAELRCDQSRSGRRWRSPRASAGAPLRFTSGSTAAYRETADASPRGPMRTGAAALPW